MDKLTPGHEVRCPNCRHGHPIQGIHSEGTAYIVRMLYFECRGNQHFAGQDGYESRHQTRLPAPQHDPASPARDRTG